MNLQGTTGVHEDAIYGSLSITCFCLLKKTNSNGKSFGRSKVTFMVCSPEVKLQRIIMGSPWMKSVKMVLSMDDKEDKAVCRLFTEGSTRRCSLQLNQINNLQMTTNTIITKADSHAIFEINSFFLQKNISLKIHEKNGIRLPEIVHLTNNIQITQDRGFPFILHNSEIKLPIKSSKNSKKRVTVSVSLINIETAASNILDASDQTP